MLTRYAKLYDELGDAIDLAAVVADTNRLVSTNLTAAVREGRRHLVSEPVKDVLAAIGYEYPTNPPDTIWRKFFLASCEISAEHGQESGRRSLAWRISQELREACDADRYCLFTTLTWAPDHYDLRRRGDVWKRYRASIQRAVCLSMYGKSKPPVGVSISDMCRYVAVQEHGKQGERHHLHVIWVLAKLPQEWTDPAAERRQYREISRARDYWPYGYSQTLPIRFGCNDAFAKIGWYWPLDKAKGFSYDNECQEQLSLVPVDTTEPQAVARYVSKYVCKPPIGQDQNPETRFRTRLTQGLGCQRLRVAIDSLWSHNPARFKAWLKMILEPCRILHQDLPVPKQVLLRETMKVLMRCPQGLTGLTKHWGSHLEHQESVSLSRPKALLRWLRTGQYFLKKCTHTRTLPMPPMAVCDAVAFLDALTPSLTVISCSGPH